MLAICLQLFITEKSPTLTNFNLVNYIFISFWYSIWKPQEPHLSCSLPKREHSITWTRETLIRCARQTWTLTSGRSSCRWTFIISGARPMSSRDTTPLDSGCHGYHWTTLGRGGGGRLSFQLGWLRLVCLFVSVLFIQYSHFSIITALPRGPVDGVSAGVPLHRVSTLLFTIECDGFF